MIRPRLIRWLGATLAVAAVTAALFVQRPDRALSTASAGEVELAVQFLDGARGASPLACEMLLRSMSTHSGWSYIHTEPGAARELVDVVGWGTGYPRDPAVVPVLRAGLDDADACVRRVSARLLGRTSTPRALESLLEALRSPQAGTRQLAALGLGYAENRSAVDPLIRALRDEAAEVRAAAAWALGAIADTEAIEPLAQLLHDDPDPGVRRSAAIALGSIL
jgi:hypothetical protein